MGILDYLFQPQQFGGGYGLPSGGLLGNMAAPNSGYTPDLQGGLPNEYAGLAPQFTRQESAKWSPVNSPAQPNDPFLTGAMTPRFFGITPPPPAAAMPMLPAPGMQPGMPMPQPSPQVPPQAPPQMAPPMSLAPSNPGSQAAVPGPSAIPQNAQPAQGQMPSGPDLGDRLSAGLHGFLNGRAFGPALSNAIQGVTSGQRSDPAGQAQQNQAATYYALRDALVSKGMPAQQAHGIAMSAAVNPEIAKTILPDALGAPKTMEEAIARQSQRPGSGGMAGAMGQYRDFLKTKSAGEAQGKTEGENAATLPTTLEKADEALHLIEQIRNHPGRQYATGALGVIPGIPGTQQRDFVNLLDQAKGQTFLQAYQTLKGGGQISNVEGAKAESAIARLDRAQTKEGFERGLDDLKEVIEAGRKRAGTLAGGAPTPGGPQVKSPAGWTELPGGYRYKQVGQ